MFTGIIETLGIVKQIEKKGTNILFKISSTINTELKIDQSVAHNGVCLTVTDIEGDTYSVTAIEETLQRTNLGKLKVGDSINLERCLAVNSRFDGHIVQGHVDTTAVCISKIDKNGSWIFRFKHEQSNEGITVQKGSICVNGVSLTVVESTSSEFSVAIIPYTFEHTTFKNISLGDTVNLEFDVIGKYVANMMEKYLQR